MMSDMNRVVTVLLLMTAQPAWVQAQSPVPQTAATLAPKFDTISIKPCRDTAMKLPMFPGGSGTSAGKLWFTCTTVAYMIERYLSWGEIDPLLRETIRPFVGHSDELDRQLIRGPEWIYSDRYDVDAATSDPEANAPTGSEKLYGSRLLSLLEDRFQLAIHQESQEAPIYELRVAVSGIKFKASLPEGCASKDEVVGRTMYSADGRAQCNSLMNLNGGAKATLNGSAVTLESLVRGVSNYFCRQVVDRTRLPGRFDFHMEYTDDQERGCAVDPRLGTNPGAAPSFVIALEQQLGLKLEPIEGQRGIVVVDHWSGLPEIEGLDSTRCPLASRARRHSRQTPDRRFPEKCPGRPAGALEPPVQFPGTPSIIRYREITLFQGLCGSNLHWIKLRSEWRRESWLAAGSYFVTQLPPRTALASISTSTTLTTPSPFRSRGGPESPSAWLMSNCISAAPTAPSCCRSHGLNVA